MERLNDDELRRWLHEDAPHGDLTTRALALAGRRGRLQFAARGEMRVAASEEAARLFELCGCEAQVIAASSSDASPGELLMFEADGP